MFHFAFLLECRLHPYFYKAFLEVVLKQCISELGNGDYIIYED